MTRQRSVNKAGAMMFNISFWAGRAGALSCVSLFIVACSARGQSDDITKSIQESVYGGDTVVDTTTSTGAIGATAILSIQQSATQVATCSGTLVSPTKVVTAAHCFQCTGVFTAAGITVSFAQGGGSFSSGLAAPPAIFSDAPGCNKPGPFDVAVVTLSTPVPPSVAQPQQILLSDPAQALADGSLVQPCSTIGYGGNVHFDSSTGAGTRRVGSIVPSWFRDTCGDVCEGLCNDDFIWRQDLSASHAVTAMGDSGGGLFCTLNGAPVLIGVTSGFATFHAFCNDEENMILAPTSGDQDVRNFFIAQIGFPNIANASSFAVYSKSSVNINDRAKVLDSNGNVGASVAAESGPTQSGGSRLGVESRVGNMFVNAGLMVSDRARVEGTLTADGQIALGNSVQGSFIRYRYSQLPGFDLPVVYPTVTAAAIILESGANASIGSESAGKLISSITVGQAANLTLSCGTTYFIDNLTINAGGRVTFDTSCGPGRMYVKTKLLINNGDIVDRNGPIGDTFVGYSGLSTVTLSGFEGTLVAPRAGVAVANGDVVLGAIFAASVVVHQDSVILHFPFNFPWI